MPFHEKNLPKGRNFTYLEDPGIDIISFNLPINLEVHLRILYFTSHHPAPFCKATLGSSSQHPASQLNRRPLSLEVNVARLDLGQRGWLGSAFFFAFEDVGKNP